MTTEVEILRLLSTAQLEGELNELSALMATYPTRFHTVSAELKRRRDQNKENKVDDQPPPREWTQEDLLQKYLDDARAMIRTLTTKVVSMEAEQAKLVVEAEAAKAAAREAQERLALVVKYTAPADPNTTKPSDPTVS